MWLRDTDIKSEEKITYPLGTPVLFESSTADDEEVKKEWKSRDEML